VDEPPVVTLVAEPTTATVPVTTRFTARAADPEGETLTYTWTFAPGVTRGGEATESYTYRKPGTFQARVAVSDGTHEVQSRPVEVTVGAPGAPIPAANREPFVDLQASPSGGVAPLTVTLTAQATDSDGDVLRYSFDFDDGSTLPDTPQAVQRRTYRNPGYYYVYVEVTDGRGGYDWDYVEINVRGPQASAPPSSPSPTPPPAQPAPPAAPTPPPSQPTPPAPPPGQPTPPARHPVNLHHLHLLVNRRRLLQNRARRPDNRRPLQRACAARGTRTAGQPSPPAPPPEEPAPPPEAPPPPPEQPAPPEEPSPPPEPPAPPA
jgi:PKD repeat protein